MARGKYRGGHPTGKRHFSHDLGQDETLRKKKAEGEESDSDESGSGSDESEAEAEEKKSAEPLIETANPNEKPKGPSSLKPGDLDAAAPVELTRREREAIEAQRAEALHWKMTKEGKTDAAQADMARLALVRQQREAAAAAKAAAAETAKAAKAPAKK